MFSCLFIFILYVKIYHLFNILIKLPPQPCYLFNPIFALLFIDSHIFQWSRNMTSNSHIFHQLQQEIEQGQIPSNTQSLRALSLRGSVYNGSPTAQNIYSNSRNNSPLTQAKYSPQDPFPNQTKNVEQVRSQKKMDRQFLTTSEIRSNQMGQRFQQSTSYWKNDNRNYQPQQSTSFNNSSGFEFDKFNSKNSYNLNQYNSYQSYRPQDYLWNQTRLDQVYGAPTYENQYYNQNFNNFQAAQPSYSKKDQTVVKLAQSKEESERKQYENYGRLTLSKIERQRKNNQEKEDVESQKRCIRQSIAKHENYFRASDWQRLLFIIQEIILENNNGIRHLWNFINKFEGSKKFRKGKRVFEILASLGMEQVFDRLIAEEQRCKQDNKQKQTNFHKLIMSLVKRID